MKTTIVTKEWLANVLLNPSLVKSTTGNVIGRALLAIYNRQTEQEQAYTHTIQQNGVGFSKPDARLGSIGARMFRAHGRLEQWIINIWLKPAKDGFPRICKYVGQLDAVAKQKQYA